MQTQPFAVFATRENLPREQIETRFGDEKLACRFALDVPSLTALAEDPDCFVIFLCTDFDPVALNLFKSRARTGAARWILLIRQGTTSVRSGLFSLGAFDVLQYPVHPVQIVMRARQALQVWKKPTPHSPHEPSPLVPSLAESSGSEPPAKVLPSEYESDPFVDSRPRLEEIRREAKPLPAIGAPQSEDPVLDQGLEGLRGYLDDRLRNAREDLGSQSLVIYSLRPNSEPQVSECPPTAFALASVGGGPQNNEALAVVDLPQLWAVFKEKRGLSFDSLEDGGFSWAEPAVTTGNDVEVAMLATYDRPFEPADTERLARVRTDLAKLDRSYRVLDFLSRVYRSMGIRP